MVVTDPGSVVKFDDSLSRFLGGRSSHPMSQHRGHGAPGFDRKRNRPPRGVADGVITED